MQIHRLNFFTPKNWDYSILPNFFFHVRYIFLPTCLHVELLHSFKETWATIGRGIHLLYLADFILMNI